MQRNKALHNMPRFTMYPAIVIALAITVITTSLSPRIGHAAMYQCVGSSGETVFSQSPCPATSYNAQRAGQDVSSLDCRIARGFMRQQATAMLRGEDFDRSMVSYGGAGNLSSAALGMINYVYSYEGNPAATVERITELGMRRCTSGTFGRVDCSVFPGSYVRSAGGCRAAAEEAPAMGAARPGGYNDRRNDAGWLEAPTPGAVIGSSQNGYKQVNQARAIEACNRRIDEQVVVVDQQLIATNSLPEIQDLHEKLRALNSQRYDCY